MIDADDLSPELAMAAVAAVRLLGTPRPQLYAKLEEHGLLGRGTGGSGKLPL